MSKRLGKRERALRRIAFQSLSPKDQQTRADRNNIKKQNLSVDKPKKSAKYVSYSGSLGSKSPRFNYPSGNLFKNYPRA